MINGKEAGIELNLSVAEINFIFQVLSKQPFDTVADLIFNLKTQVDEQVDSKAEGLPAPTTGN